MRALIGQLAIYQLPVGARQEKLNYIKLNWGKFSKSPLLCGSNCTDEKCKWKVEVEESTQLSFWRKVKRSSEKFALEKFITVFFAAGSLKEKPSEGKFFEDLSPKFKVHLQQRKYKSDLKWKCIN